VFYDKDEVEYDAEEEEVFISLTGITNAETKFSGN
jgi:hypothetical protein